MNLTMKERKLLGILQPFRWYENIPDYPLLIFWQIAERLCIKGYLESRGSLPDTEYRLLPHE